MAVESATAKGPSRGLRAAGAAMVVISTVAIAIVPTFARLAFDGGSNTLTIITGRSILSILITFLLILALRRPLKIAKKPLLMSLAMGVDYAVMLYGYVGAVEYLPVNMVILIYFIHPLLVGFVIMYLGQEGLTPMSVVALVAALVGLGLAVGFSFERLNLTGLGLATLGMMTAAIYIVGNARAVRQAPGLTVAFYMTLSAAIALAILFFFFGTLALPTTALAWMGFTGVASTAGTLTFLCGMAYVGAARAAMISNLEPVLGVLFAMTVLGERDAATGRRHRHGSCVHRGDGTAALTYQMRSWCSTVTRSARTWHQTMGPLVKRLVFSLLDTSFAQTPMTRNCSLQRRLRTRTSPPYRTTIRSKLVNP